ncbi:MAG TPA: hypothetical protein VGH90_03450 [Chthoniobacteraceae bacterium]
MKTFYAAVFGLSLLFGTFFAIPPIPSEMLPGERLLRDPEMWNVSISDSAAAALRVSPEQIKAIILSSLRTSYSSRVDLAAASIFGGALIFSAIGWLRERRFEKQKTVGSTVTWAT